MLIERQQGEHGPRHIPGIAADVIAVFNPFVLSGLPPARKGQRPMFHRTGEIGISKPAIGPIAIVIESYQDGLANSRGLVGTTAPRQSDDGNGIVV